MCFAHEKNGDKIAVETACPLGIKSFVRPSAISEFHTAVGQYRNYYLALRSDEPERALYLAVPEDAYDKFFRLAFVQEAIQFNNVSLLIYDAQKEVIVKWEK